MVQTASPGFPQPLVSRTVYDDLGRAVWTLDAKSVNPSQAEVAGVGTHTTYDKLGRVTLTERYDGIAVRLTGGGDEHAAEVAKDAAGKPITGKLLSKSETHYDDLGQVDYTVSATGAKTAYAYDKLGRQTHVTVDDGQYTVTTETRYDATGRAVKVSAPSDVLGKGGPGQPAVVQHVWTETEYDADGRAVRTLYPDATATQVTYDAQGRKESETDALGRVTGYGYDAKTGRLTAVTQPQVADHTGVKTTPVTKYGYDEHGNLTSITDALGRVTTFAYDIFGRQRSRTLPFDLTTTKATEEKSYNAFGDLDWAVDFNGAKVDSVYDYEDAKSGTKLGRLMGILDQSGQPLETYEYDSYGRRSKVTQAGGDVYGYGYDAEGRLTQETMPAGTINYGYDETTGRHTSTETSKTHVEYGYDPLGRLTSVDVTKRNGVSLTLPEGTTYAYTPAGNVATVEVKTGAVTLRASAYVYDGERPWVKSLTHQSAKTVPDPVDPNQTITVLRPASQFVYQRTADGQIRHVAESVRQPDDAFEVTAAVYTYDALNRLSREAVQTTSTTAPGYVTDYTLDVVGNRRRQTTNENGTVTVIDGTFNARDQLTGQVTTVDGDPAGSTTFTYDLNGAETQRKNQNGDTTDSKWTVLGRLGDVTVTVGGIQTNVHYSYNPDGIRTAEVVTAGGPPATTRHLVDSVNPTGYQQDLELRAGDGALLKTIITGLELLSRTGQDHDGTAWHPDVTTYLLTDVHSGVRQRTSLLGVVAATRFAAFGTPAGNAYTYELPNDPTNFDPNQRLYRGEHTDAVTGAVYLRQRWYDLTTGRLQSMDSFAGILSQPMTLHKFAFAISNPLIFHDPTGLFPTAAATTGLSGFLASDAFKTIVIVGLLVGATILDRTIPNRMTVQLQQGFSTSANRTITAPPHIGVSLFEVRERLYLFYEAPPIWFPRAAMPDLHGAIVAMSVDISRYPPFGVSWTGNISRIYFPRGQKTFRLDLENNKGRNLQF